MSSGASRPESAPGFIASRPSPDAIRAALGFLPGRAVATDHEWWQCANALKAAYAVDVAALEAETERLRAALREIDYGAPLPRIFARKVLAGEWQLPLSKPA